MVVFYPIALESINEVTSLANEKDVSEYEIFRRFVEPEKIERQFKAYLLYRKIPPMIRQQCRNYLE